MPYKSKEDKREYNRLWLQRKRVGLKTSMREKLSDEKLYSNKLERIRRYRQEKVKEAEKVFGVSCFLCGGVMNLALHRKDGMPHTKFMPMLALKDPEEWVRLCYPCHKAVHWSMQHLDMSWGDIIERFR